MNRHLLLLICFKTFTSLLNLAFISCELEFECPDPPSIENADSKLHSDVENIPILGASVTYSCKAGYEFANNDSTTLECILRPHTDKPMWKGEIPVCKGKEVEEYPSNCTMDVIRLQDSFDNLFNLSGEEQLQFFCKNMKYIYRRLNDNAQQATGFNMKEMVHLQKESNLTNFMKIAVNIEELVEEVCTVGSENYEEIECPDPPAVENTEFKLHSDKESLRMLGASVTYSCKTGYEFISRNSTTLECVSEPRTNKPMWKGEIPVCKGKEIEEDPFNCTFDVIRLQDGVDNLLSLSGEEQLQFFCKNMKHIFRCLNNYIQTNTGFTMKEMVYLQIESDITEYLKIVVNTEELVEEVCTVGSEPYEDYMASADCFSRFNMTNMLECNYKLLYYQDTLRELDLMREDKERDRSISYCASIAYQLGCIGEGFHDICGQDHFDTFKLFIHRTGYFSSYACPPNFIEIIKMTFINRLDMSDHRKNLYRSVMD